MKRVLHRICSALSEAAIVVPDNVTNLGESAFSCDHLHDVTLGSSVETIGNHAFRRTAIEQITIPQSTSQKGL